MRKAVIVLGVLLMLAGMGCAALSSYITPAEVDKGAIKYVVDAEVADGNDYVGYPNVMKADRLKQDLDAAYSLTDLCLQQKIQVNNTKYASLKKVVTTNSVIGHQREEMLFGETGLLSLGLSMLGAGGFAGFLGLMRKRPGDITKEEYETAIASAEGKTRDELTTKQRQFAQLVKGIGEFMDTHKDSAVIEILKDTFDRTQDTDTQIAVAAVKKS